MQALESEHVPAVVQLALLVLIHLNEVREVNQVQRVLVLRVLEDKQQTGRHELQREVARAEERNELLEALAEGLLGGLVGRRAPLAAEELLHDLRHVVLLDVEVLCFLLNDLACLVLQHVARDAESERARRALQVLQRKVRAEELDARLPSCAFAPSSRPSRTRGR